MFIPNTISSNTLQVYHGSIKKGIIKSKRLLKCEDFYEWCSTSSLSLKTLCLNSIILNWQENPIINEFVLDEDARYVLDHLPTNLPYKTAIARINDELYWRRAFKGRWPGKMLPEKPQRLDYEIPNQFDRNSILNQGICVKLNTWKCFYIERHLQDLLEHLKPEQYDPEEMKDVIELSKDYVIRLKLNQLQAPIKHDKERIPLNAILPALPNLKQLTICFKQTYVGDDFSWHILQTTQKDIDNLAMGLKSCNLNVLRIINTDITCNKLTTIAWNLLSNKQLRILDFSHCKIADKGTIAICKLIQELPSLQEVNLMNNFICTKGVEMLSFTLCNEQVRLRRLNLSLNNFGATATDFLAEMLCKNKQLTFLNLSGCGLARKNVGALINALELNDTLLEFDLSNNNLEAETGKLLHNILMTKTLKSKKFNLKKIDLRMTCIPADVVLDIEELLLHNNNKCIKTRLDDEKTLLMDINTKMERENNKNIETELNKNELETELKLENVFREFIIKDIEGKQDQIDVEEEETEEEAANESENEQVGFSINNINGNRNQVQPEAD